MTLRKTSFFACLALSMFCLAAGYAASGKWVGGALAVATGLAWLPARKYPASELPVLCLLSSVCLGAVGLLTTGSAPALMLSGTGFALATWDLLLLDDALKGSSSGGQTRRYENKHLQSLALALGIGLVAALGGHLLNFEIPFAVMMLCVLLLLLGLERGWSAIKKR